MLNDDTRRNIGASLLVAAAVATSVIGPVMFGCVRAYAQTKPAGAGLPAFEVASVTRATTDRLAATGSRSWGDLTNRVVLRHIPLGNLLSKVYKLRRDQIVGPGWLDSDFFDIFAIVPAGASKEQVPLMFQALLAERFHLQYHWRVQAAATYALVVGPGGPTLKEAAPDKGAKTNTALSAKQTGTGERTTISGLGAGALGRFKLAVTKTGLHYEYPNMPMKALAEFLNQGIVDLPVVDMTNLRGAYQVSLDVPMNALPRGIGETTANQRDNGEFVPSAPEPALGSIQASLEKLGLTLVRRKLQTRKLAIDHIDRVPTPN